VLSVSVPHVRHIRGQLWEIRLKGKAGIARAFYVTAKEQRVVRRTCGRGWSEFRS
jgi:hypothetical protein